MARKTIIGKHALIQVAQGQKEIAAQLFVYDQIREIRVDMEKFEVKVLMTYDEAYFRVFAAKPEETEEGKEKAKTAVLKFYTELVNASMKLTDEEKENLKKQAEARAKQMQEASEETKEEA